MSKSDLTYGWVSSETIDSFWNSSDSAPGAMGSQNYPKYYIDDSKRVVGLEDIVAYLPTGELADPETYALQYQKEGTTQIDRATVTSYTDIEGLPVETGNYNIVAKGTGGASAGTQTSGTQLITVAVFAPSVNRYRDSSAAVRLGRASQVAATAVKKASICDVVVPASDWRYQLIGAGLAGVGQGALLFDDGADYSSRAMTAFSESNVAALQVVGSTTIVPESASPSSEVYLMDFLNERGIQYKTRYSNDATIQELADQVYATMKRLKDTGNDVYGDGWGTTAIVMSPDCCIDTLPVAQLAYTQKAPVFFVGSDGLLSATDLGYLKDGGFETVVVAGDSSYVSDGCLVAIQSACSIAPTRMLDAGQNSFEACLDYVTSTGTSTSTVAIAATNDPANSVAAAIIAATRGGTVFTCSSTSDAKRIQDYLRAIIAEKGQPYVATVYLVGDFTNVDSGLYDRISAMWTSPLATEVGIGDSFEIGDYVYLLKAGNTAQCMFVRNPDLTDAVVDDVAYDGVAYAAQIPASGAFDGHRKLESVTFESANITSVPANAFAGNSLPAVNLGTHITSVGEGAFANCAALASVEAPAVTAVGPKAFAGCTALSSISASKLASLGASAFQGCTALEAIAADSVTSLGASAFQGCTALKSASLGKVTAVADSAFAGCTHLSTLSMGSAKTLGASAFQGCTGLKMLTLGKVTSVGASAFQGCTVLRKATLTSATTLGASAFQGCTRLTSVSAAKVATIGASAFAGCKALTSYKSQKATTIGASAFEGCAKLATATFSGTGLKKIGAKAFKGCSKLKKLTLNTKKLTSKKVGANAFSGTQKKAKVYVPKSKIKAYKKFFVKKGLNKRAKILKV